MGKTIEQVLSTYQVLYLILAQAIAHQNGLHNPKERKKYHAPDNSSQKLSRQTRCSERTLTLFSKACHIPKLV